MFHIAPSLHYMRGSNNNIIVLPIKMTVIGLCKKIPKGQFVTECKLIEMDFKTIFFKKRKKYYIVGLNKCK